MHDADGFFDTILPSLAVTHEPLLNAVVGFATYHATLQNPNGKLRDFLKYYNKSVTLLLESINRKEINNILNLVTILQLLTIEVRQPSRLYPWRVMADSSTGVLW
jgi:NifB/MoaA-like Fe-S oxidoreductase